MPDVIHEPHFGVLVRAASQGYKGSIEWRGLALDLSLGADDEGGILGSIAAARMIQADQETWDDAVRRCAVDHLLELKNDVWREDGEVPVQADLFARRMNLQGIDIQPTGFVEFMFGDDDMFWGHWISVTGNVSEGPDFAEIMG